MQLRFGYFQQFDSVIAKVKEGAVVDLSSLPPPLDPENISVKPKPSDMVQRQESIRQRSSNQPDDTQRLPEPSPLPPGKFCNF